MSEFQKVQSSIIKAVSYDEDSEVLRVKFKKGAVYQYHGVKKETFKKLRLAPSIGSYFCNKIRNDYPWQKEDPDEDQ